MRGDVAIVGEEVAEGAVAGSAVVVRVVAAHDRGGERYADAEHPEAAGAVEQRRVPGELAVLEGRSDEPFVLEVDQADAEQQAETFARVPVPRDPRETLRFARVEAFAPVVGRQRVLAQRLQGVRDGIEDGIQHAEHHMFTINSLRK